MKHYFYRLSGSYEDGSVEPVEDLVRPQGLSDVWFRGRARREPGQLLGTREVRLARKLDVHVIRPRTPQRTGP